MKPCSKNRKPIAWLALGALEAQEAAALREHLTLCEGCRRYWEEISNLTEALTSGKPDSDLKASEMFHHRVAGRLQAVESTSVLENLAAWRRGTMLNWRWALPATAVLAVALLAIVGRREHPASFLPAPPPVQVVSASGSESDLAPTIANYQMVANQSLEKLSELLTRQGNKSLPPAPVYSTSSLELTDSQF